MRLVLAAAVLLCASACCVDVASDDACVVDRPPQRPYCFPLPRTDLVCWDADAQPPPLGADYRSCEGVLHEGVDCEDRGFTQRCHGDLFVRPGEGC